MANYFNEVSRLQAAIDALDEYFGGDESTTVTYNGKTKNSIEKSFSDRFAGLQAMVNGRLTFATKALMDAAGAPPNNELAEVWNDPTPGNNKLYGWDETHWTESKLSSYTDLKTRIQETDVNLKTRIPEQPLPHSLDNFVWAITDSEGKVGMGLKSNGEFFSSICQEVMGLTQRQHSVETQVLAVAPDGSTDIAWGISDQNGALGLALTRDGKLWATLANPESLRFKTDENIVWSVADAAGQVALGIDKSGRTVGEIANRCDNIDQALSACDTRLELLEGSRFTSDDASPLVLVENAGDFDQLVVIDADGKHPLTDGSYNARNPSVHKNSYVKFSSDRDGVERLYRMLLSGQTVCKSHNNTLEHILIIGQSNSIPKRGMGVDASLTGDLVNDPYGIFMFNGWVNPNRVTDSAWWDTALQDVPIDPGNMAYLIPAGDGLFNNESHGFGACEAINSQAERLFLISGHGKGGASYSVLKKDVPAENYSAYRNSIEAVAAGKRAANALGLDYKVTALFCEHGESDAQNSGYLDHLIEWRDNYNADIKRITGQADNIPLLISQQNSWSLGGNFATSKSVIAQYQFQRDGYGYLVAPKYFIPHDANGPTNPDGIHTSAYGTRLLDEYYAKALQAGETWSPLMPESVQANGKTITVSFAGRVGDLRFNIYHETNNPHGVSDPGQYGFELLNAGGIAITSVVLSDDKTQVIVATDGDVPNGTELAYAYTGELMAHAGPLTGPRGCLADSDTTPPSEKLQNWRATQLGMNGAAVTEPLCNWCVTFLETVEIL
ncbi:hypothetical protein ACJJIQ_00255 (plasmid) [Microbulbifer sp. ANSA003]|uniref:hypothetical protein n=1 Tax=Microbulbifer sp. ANSA003 TaxID=3243360 RepID=UPI004042900B